MHSTRQEINGLQMVSVHETSNGRKVELDQPEPLVAGESFELDLAKVQGFGDETLHDLITRLCSEYQIRSESQQAFHFAGYQSVVGILPDKYVSVECPDFIPVAYAGQETRRMLVFYIEPGEAGGLHADLMKFSGQAVCSGRNSNEATTLESGEGVLLVQVNFDVKALNPDQERGPVAVYHFVGENEKQARTVEGERVLTSIRVFAIDAIPSMQAAAERAAELDQQYRPFKSYEYNEFFTEIAEFVRDKFTTDNVSDVVANAIVSLGGIHWLFSGCSLRASNESASQAYLKLNTDSQELSLLVDRLQTRFGHDFCEIAAIEKQEIRLSLVAVNRHLAAIRAAMNELAQNKVFMEQFKRPDAATAQQAAALAASTVITSTVTAAAATTTATAEIVPIVSAIAPLVKPVPVKSAVAAATTAATTAATARTATVTTPKVTQAQSLDSDKLDRIAARVQEQADLVVYVNREFYEGLRLFRRNFCATGAAAQTRQAADKIAFASKGIETLRRLRNGSVLPSKSDVDAALEVIQRHGFNK